MGFFNSSKRTLKASASRTLRDGTKIVVRTHKDADGSQFIGFGADDIVKTVNLNDGTVSVTPEGKKEDKTIVGNVIGDLSEETWKAMLACQDKDALAKV